MSKIYEALMNSRRDLTGTDAPETGRAGEKIKVPPPVDFKPRMEKEMSELYHSVAMHLGDGSNSIIQFIGAGRKGGTSTIAREFAMTTAFSFKKAVLLLDADQENPSQQLFFGISGGRGWEEAVRDGQPAETAFHRVGNSSLFVCPPSGPSSSSCQASDKAGSPALDQAGLNRLWAEVMERNFSIVVIDSPPAGSSFDSTIFSRGAHRVVLVLGAESARLQTAKKLKARIAKNGGYLLGAVLNRRRYHIPEFIYKRL